MSRPEAEIPLDRGALLIAAEADPSLDMATELRRLDRLADQVEASDCSSVCRLLFDQLGFRGDRDAYDDPQNSFLHRVIARRKGIPITLSVLLIEIGRRCGVPLEGVGMPGHFLVRDPNEPDLLIDAFAAGRRLDEAECVRLMRSVVGPTLEFQPKMLRPVGPVAVLARMLANLDASFTRRHDLEGRRWVTRLRSSLPGLPIGGRVALADGLAELGSYDEAAELLEGMAADPATPVEIAAMLKARARKLLSRLN